MTSHGGIVVPDVMGAVSECQECQAPKPRAPITRTMRSNRRAGRHVTV